MKAVLDRRTIKAKKRKLKRIYESFDVIPSAAAVLSGTYDKEIALAIKLRKELGIS